MMEVARFGRWGGFMLLKERRWQCNEAKKFKRNDMSKVITNLLIDYRKRKEKHAL